MKKEHDLAKWLSGEMNAKELREFEKSAEYDSYQKIAKYTAELDAPVFDNELMLQKIITREKATPKVIPLHRKFMFRVAAVLIIVLGSFLFFQTTQQITENTAAGMKTEFILPDDSEVVLNSDSEIHYKKWNWKNNRNLRLNGEAFFKVAEGKTFTVNTNLGNVTVVGTQFSVKSRDDRFEVECFEGKVKVAFQTKNILLTKGEIIVIEDGEFLSAMPTNGHIPDWMNKELRIISLPLKDILSEIERNYAIAIDEGEFNSVQKFSGFLPADDLKTALEIISKTYNFSYKIDTKSTVVSIEKQP